jgi:branched-chain amino acid transport system permease protein
MSALLQAVWAGALFGSVYGLMAIGLTMIYGSLNLLNLAHGTLYIVGGYVAWTFLAVQLPILPAFAVGVIGAGIVGGIMYFAVVRPMLGRPGWDEASWIATLGVALVLENVALLVYGSQVKQLPAVIPGEITILGVVISFQGIFVIAVAVLSLLVLNYFLRTSRHGLAIRAVSQHMVAARLMGIRVGTIFLIVMCVSGALAGLAGVLLTSILYLSPTAGFLPMLKALIVTIFGGLGSVKGTIVAAYVIGLLEAFVQVYFGVGWSLPALFLFIICVLIVRPNGLFGLGETQRL